MPRSRRDLGNEAEDRAATYLLSLGYSLITRRYSARGGEIDIIAMDGTMLVFVEVKSRRDSLPEEALTPRKSSRLKVAANAYMNAVDSPSHPYRFDLVAVTPSEIRHYPGVAFHSSEPTQATESSDEWSPDPPAG